MKPSVSIFRPGPPGYEILRLEGGTGAIPVHVHASWCVVAVASGERTVTAGDARLVLGPGDAAVIPPGLAHGCSPSCGCVFFALSIPDSLMPAGTRPRERLVPLSDQCGTFTPDRLEELLAARDRATALALPASLARMLAAHAAVESARETVPPVRKAMAVLDGPDSTDIRMDGLSRLAGASRFHLSRAFKKATGLPPGEYRTLSQLRRARALLAAGSPLADVAAECGFFDQSHLSHRFKKYMGMTPGLYARACR
ncbi:MAG: helix-turn-helix domain-containing protein [Thermodesulfobacteriota bacterium]